MYYVPIRKWSAAEIDANSFTNKYEINTRSVALLMKEWIKWYLAGVLQIYFGVSILQSISNLFFYVLKLLYCIYARS